MAGKSVSKEMEIISSDPSSPRRVVENSKSPLSWSSLFRQGNANKLKTTLNFYKPSFVDGVAEVPDEVIEKGRKDWEDYLVGSFVGKRLPFPLVRDALQKQWKIQKFEMVADDEVFYFKFQSEEDKILVIEKGPIFIAGRLFVLRFWSPEIEKGRNLISSVPIWVKLEGVPKRLWSEEGLGFLGSLIGSSCVRDSQGVEINPTDQQEEGGESRFKVVERTSPPRDTTKQLVVVETPNTSNRFQCLQGEEENDQSADMRVDDASVGKLDEIPAIQEVDKEKELLLQDKSTNSAIVEVIEPVIVSQVEATEVDEFDNTLAIVVVGDENIVEAELPQGELEMSLLEDVPETPVADIMQYTREKEMYEALVDEEIDNSDDDPELEEVEIFKDHIMKELPTPAEQSAKVHRNIKIEAKAKALATVEKKKKGRSKGPEC
ncbi:hypothetical protein FRX31_008320 [Thalictrum thalictroides]|uniref:DUF4283 domain-containing protein n=1 Tax=Thalictrum thalictroides TaxID=46969 RepID=A0A7J6X029_THATH|nr:hypothetical protein FRX31_008320 [Thalictrum thalictroides]